MEINKEKEEYLAEIRKIRDYAQEEFDKLIVYLSSGGLVLTVGFIKDIIDLNTSNWNVLLILTWVSFVLTLLTNLLSHRFSIKAMTLELEGNEVNSDKFDTVTNFFNWLSFSLLISAIVTFIVFVIINQF